MEKNNKHIITHRATYEEKLAAHRKWQEENMTAEELYENHLDSLAQRDIDNDEDRRYFGD